MAELLLYRGINMNTRDDEGRSVMMYACEHCSIDILQQLVEMQMDPNATDNQGIIIARIQTHTDQR